MYGPFRPFSLGKKCQNAHTHIYTLLVNFFSTSKKAPKRLSWGRRRLGPRFAREFTDKNAFWALEKPVLYVNSRANRGPGWRLLQKSLFEAFWGGSKNHISHEDGAKKSKK